MRRLVHIDDSVDEPDQPAPYLIRAKSTIARPVDHAYDGNRRPTGPNCRLYIGCP